MQTQAKTTSTELPPTERKRAVKIIARSLYKELTAQGYDERQIVSVATELISEVTRTLGSDPSHP